MPVETDADSDHNMSIADEDEQTNWAASLSNRFTKSSVSWVKRPDL